MKVVLKITSTNWIHLVGFYITTFLTLLLFKATGLSGESDTWMNALATMPSSVLGLFFLYGPVIIGSFYIALIILDIVCFRFTKLSVWKIILLEWIVIITPFIIWAFEYKYWLWIFLSFSFFVTQLLRKTKIERFLEIDNRANSKEKTS